MILPTVRFCLKLLPVLTLSAVAFAHPDPEDGDAKVVRVSDGERYQPRVVPDRIILTWSGDPRTTQSVTWRTSTHIGIGLAEIALAEHGPKFPAAAKTVVASTRLFKTDLSAANVHVAKFANLTADTLYAYRVGDGVNWSEWFQFRTAPESGKSFSFVYMGDAQNEIRSMWSRVTREAFRSAPHAAFFLHAGDLVDRADSDGQWGEWFEAGGFINATIPVIATPGNHEYMKREGADKTVTRELTQHFGMSFAFPENGPADLKTSVYYVDYADLRIISLNSNEKQAEQVAWLDEVLSKSDRKWTAVTFHHPIFSTGRGRDNPELRSIWKPIFDRHAVDLVLTGHDHTYGRSGLIGSDVENVPTGRTSRSDVGTVYVVSVSGPKMYDPNPDPGIDYVRRAEDTQLYQVITIAGDELRYEARTAMGALYDSFTLVKTPAGPNTLIENAVSMPARRR